MAAALSRQGIIGTLLLLCWQAPLLAQQQYHADYLLFEAHPLPPGPVSGMPFSSAAPSAPLRLTGNSPAARPAPATPVDRPTVETTVAAYQSNLASFNDVDTPYSPELIEQLLGLSAAQQQLGDHTDALATLERAEFLSRVNNGLYSPEQFAVVELMVENLIDSGDMQQAMEKQQYLLYLQQQYYGNDSKELAPGLERLGDWSMSVFNRGVTGSNSVGFAVSTGSRRAPALSPRGLAVMNLEIARFRYFQAIRNLVQARDLGNPQLPGLEEKFLQNLYLAGHRNGLISNPAFYIASRGSSTGSRISVNEFETNLQLHATGRDALQRLLFYQSRYHNTDATTLLNTMLNLADWHLLFNRRREAMTVYADSWKLVQSTPGLAEASTNLLQPPLPQQLPAFMALPHSRGHYGIAEDAVVEFDGYIDVSYDLTRNGDVENLRVVASSEGVPTVVERRLRRLLQGAPQRPRLQDGVPVASTGIKVRYYFADTRDAATLVSG